MAVIIKETGVIISFDKPFNEITDEDLAEVEPALQEVIDKVKKTHGKLVVNPKGNGFLVRCVEKS